MLASTSEPGVPCWQELASLAGCSFYDKAALARRAGLAAATVPGPTSSTLLQRPGAHAGHDRALKRVPLRGRHRWALSPHPVAHCHCLLVFTGCVMATQLGSRTPPSGSCTLPLACPATAHSCYALGNLGTCSQGPGCHVRLPPCLFVSLDNAAGPSCAACSTAPRGGERGTLHPPAAGRQAGLGCASPCGEPENQGLLMSSSAHSCRSVITGWALLPRLAGQGSTGAAVHASPFEACPVACSCGTQSSLSACPQPSAAPAL